MLTLSSTRLRFMALNLTPDLRRYTVNYSLRRKWGPVRSDSESVGSILAISNAKIVPPLFFHERFNEASACL